MNEPRQCAHVKGDGERCGVTFGLSDAGLCYNHDPERAEARQEAKSRGGKATAKKQRKGTGLDMDELPPLVSHEAAETWTDVIGRAAATGRLSSSAANAALRAVKEWRESHDAGAVSERLDALTAAMRKWRKTGDPAPVLELVKGGES